jgi:hypothetical protein
MIITKQHLSRRTVLRGLGVTIALPLLDGMVPALTAMSKTAAQPVRRFGAFYVPMGVNMKQWTPETLGRNFELTPTLRTIAAYKDQLTVITGLDSHPAQPGDDDGGGPHSRVMSAWLTGAHALKTEGTGKVNQSMDQVAAQAFGDQTQFKSLELGLESVDILGVCDYGYSCAYTSTISWSTPTNPLPMEINPRALFERLFGDNSSTDSRVRLASIRRDGSLLDSVTTEVATLQKSLGQRDQTKVAEYLDAVRDAERRIQRAEQDSGRELPLVEQPAGIPASFEDHGKLMMDLLALAWQSDMTRVSTFVISRELSNRTYPEIGIADANHPLSHHQNNPEKLAKQAKLNAFHLKMFSHFLDKLKATPDGDGTLLEHSAILYGCGMSDSNLHMPENLPTLIVGGASHGIKGGNHLKVAKGTPLCNLQLTMLHRMGVSVPSFGDSTGEVTEL